MTVAERLARRVLNAQGYRSRFLSTRRGKVHMLDGPGQGKLPPIVMLHGISANAISFTSLIRHIAPHTRRVIAPDCPGHGFSETPAAGLDRDAMADGLAETLDQVIDEPSIILGTSMGGFAAVRYAAQNPDRIRGLALVCPGGAPMPAAQLQAFLDRFRIDRYEQAFAFVDRMFAGKAGLLRPFLAHGIRGRFSHPEMRRLLDSIGPEDMLTPEELRALSMPTLLLWGREERILPADNLEFFRTHMPDHAEIEEWSDFGHCGFLERPERVARRIVGFARSTVPTQHRLRVSTRVGNRDTLRISA
ncbi:MAG: alpha/beta hydrolase [Nannocystaceae bacterium]